MFFQVLSITAFAQSNFLVIVADDLGTDKLSRYQVDVPGYVPAAGDMPVTPAIDGLTSDGVRFRNAWANPVCSPTRAGMMTGRHAWRTRVGGVVEPDSLPTPGLRDNERTLAEVLDATYATGWFGKWHLGEEGLDADGDDDPLDWTTTGTRDAVPNPSRQGFEIFDGIIGGAVPTYFNWTRVVAESYGVVGGDETSTVEVTSTYATADTAERASHFMVTAPEPWLAVVGFAAPHLDGNGYDPRHAEQGCSTITAATTDREAYRAMVECVDFYIDAMLADLQAADRLDDTIIVFLGDNGTEPSVIDPDFPHADGGKGTAYESGVRVPLVVTDGKHFDARPYGTRYFGVPYALGDAINVATAPWQPVHTVDLFDTVLALAGLPQTGQDSVSFAPQLLDPLAPGRMVNYTERFVDIDEDGVFAGFAAIRSPRYKLIVTQGDDGTATPCQRGALFDLWTDRDEATNLYSDAARVADRDLLRAIVDAQITAYETVPGNPPHWMWRVADAPRTTGACN